MLICKPDAWSDVYESASTITVGYLKDARHIKFKLAWRGVVILCFMAVLLVTQIPFGNRYWLYVYGMPFKCFWQWTSGNYDKPLNLGTMSVNMFWIFWGMLKTLNNYFPMAFGWLFPNPVSTWIASTLVKLMLLPRRLNRYSRRRSQETHVTSKITRMLFGTLWAISYPVAVFVFIFAEITDSEAFSMQGDWYLIVNNIYWSLKYRSTAPGVGRVGDESKWGFGQAVPVFLLGLPLAAVAEAIHGTLSISIQIPCVCGTEVLTSVV